MPHTHPRISFIGDGSWGTTLAVHLARQGIPVTLWGAFPDNIEQLTRDRENKRFLPGIKLPRKIQATTCLESAVTSAEIIVLSTPSQYLEDVLKKIAVYNLRGKKILSIVKGIENRHLLRMSQLIHNHLGRVPLAVLSGPTIAMEVANKIPSSAVIASKNRTLAKYLQSIFHSETFRIYTNTDIIGVELGGSMKNVIAIACGLCDGLGFGTNTKSALLARGLAEMSRLGTALGARSRTFAGLTGLGDLVTTCFSPRSRNRSVGEQLGRGRSIAGILKDMTMVAEGVETCRAIDRLARSHHIEVPITHEVYRIIYHHKKPLTAVQHLMKRSVKSE